MRGRGVYVFSGRHVSIPAWHMTCNRLCQHSMPLVMQHILLPDKWAAAAVAAVRLVLQRCTAAPAGCYCLAHLRRPDGRRDAAGRGVRVTLRRLESVLEPPADCRRLVLTAAQALDPQAGQLAGCIPAQPLLRGHASDHTKAGSLGGHHEAIPMPVPHANSQLPDPPSRWPSSAHPTSA